MLLLAEHNVGAKASQRREVPQDIVECIVHRASDRFVGGCRRIGDERAAIHRTRGFVSVYGAIEPLRAHRLASRGYVREKLREIGDCEVVAKDDIAPIGLKVESDPRFR